MGPIRREDRVVELREAGRSRLGEAGLEQESGVPGHARDHGPALEAERALDVLEPGEDQVFRYRLVVHRGKGVFDHLQQRWEQFASEPDLSRVG